MPFTLRDVLDLDVLREAGPEVLVGAGSLDREVRWVHSSEIFEIGPLLSGGELLLTTGLGLAGPDAGARRHYVRDLADRGVSGLVLELGRTFEAVPGELVEEARRYGLPLIALTEVVPFIRISQAANTAIVDGETARLRLGDQVSRALNDALVAGSGVGGLLAAAAAVTGSSLVVLSAAGALVAGSGVGDHRHAWSVVDGSRHVVPVRVRGQVWGRLVAGPGAVLTDGDLFAVLERTSAALSLAVLLTGSPPSRHDRLAAELLADLADPAGHSVPGEADHRLRAGAAGFVPRADQQIVPVAVDGPESGPALAMLERSARRLGTPRMAGRVVPDILALLVVGAGRSDAVESGRLDVVGAGGPDAVGAAQAAIEEARSRVGAPELTVALGPAAPGDAGPAVLAAGLRTARAALRLTVAERARGGAPVATSRTFALELELMAGGDPGRLERLASSLIGPLVHWDAAHRSELVRTLEVLLRHGGSPTRAAAALHLGRQSLYQRIERIESLLGVRVDDPSLHAALLLATCAHRISLP
jgi:PucR family transcriptional regulator, purine catabolism regulatory protein